MPRVVSALTARAQFGQILDRVSENGERFVVDRRGEPTAVIMSLRDFVNTIAPPPNFLKEIWAESERRGADKLTMREIDAEIRAYRREKRAKDLAATR
jgi:prevent-host-death family protein